MQANVGTMYLRFGCWIFHLNNIDMELRELFLFEIEGITRTIKDYTSDNFVKSYADKLLELSYPEDSEQIFQVCSRLKTWYDKYYKEITSNQFIHNIEAHHKSYELINHIMDNIARESLTD